VNLNRPLPEPYRDVALLLARVLLAVVMFAHGYQKMVINGIGRTTQGFESLSIPLAIVSASFVTVVEFAGSALLLLGALTPLIAACNLVIMIGAAAFVHAKNGIFIADGGWELVGVIGAGFLLLAAVGPGRFSVDHVVSRHQAQHREALAAKARPATAAWPRDTTAAAGPAAARIGADLWTPPEGTAAGTATGPLPRRAPRGAVAGAAPFTATGPHTEGFRSVPGR
jgi:putative oxidoreductase